MFTIVRIHNKLPQKTELTTIKITTLYHLTLEMMLVTVRYSFFELTPVEICIPYVGKQSSNIFIVRSNNIKIRQSKISQTINIDKDIYI